MVNDLSSAAQHVAAAGAFIFPCALDKRPIVERGFRSATRDPDDIGEMFSRRGAALIGVATEASELVVVDVDARGDNDGRLWVYENTHRLPETRMHRTPSGGAHLIFATPRGPRIPSGNNRLGRGIDVKAGGGYVIWPSGLEDGYTVARDVAPAVLPQWLAEACRPPEPPPPAPAAPIRLDGPTSRYGAGALRRACERIGVAGFGSQEATLNAEAFAIGRLAGGGALGEAEALRALTAAGLAMPSQPGREPWRPAEVERKVRSAFEAGKRQPREVPPPPASMAGRRGLAHAR